MKLTAREISELVEGKLEAGRDDIIVTGAQGIAEAGPGDITFISNPKYQSQVRETKAGLLLVPLDLPVPSRPVIRVKNAQLAFAKILWVLYKERLAKIPSGIHASAIIAPDAIIGDGVSIGALCVVESGAKIGKNSRIMAQCYVGNASSIGEDCLIYPQVVIREEITIGDRVIIHSGTEIGSDGFGFVPYDKGLFKIPQIGSVTIGNDVEIGANVAIDRATTGVTSIGKGTKMDNLVHIAHNVQIGESCVIVGQVGMAGSTRLGNGVTVAAQSGVGGHLKIGDRATIAARSGVTTDVKSNEVVSGFPARPHREELRIQALMRRLPVIYERIRKLDE